jgi:hypothetical protein
MRCNIFCSQYLYLVFLSNSFFLDTSSLFILCDMHEIDASNSFGIASLPIVNVLIIILLD